jgi:uncharacterized protein (DUF1015 family)
LTWFNPFRIIVPASDKPHLVASRSYLSYGKAELQDKLDRNPYSYLHVINPAGTSKSPAKRGSEAFYQLVRQRFESFLADGWLQAQEAPAFAIYRQTRETHVCTGVVGVLGIQSVEDGRLKLHEQTLEKREKLFAKYLDTVGCHAEPILCMYPDAGETGQGVSAWMVEWTERNRPDMDFSTTDRIRHSVWTVPAEEAADFPALVNALEAVYLADGHHRIASSRRLAAKYPNEPAKQGVLAYAVPASELIIRPYHRELVHGDWDAERWEAAFETLGDCLHWDRIDGESGAPNSVGVVHVHTAAASWRLQWNDELLNRGEVDAELLQTHVFERVFRVVDARNDPRLKYVPGTVGSLELKARAAKHPDCALFELHAVTPEQLMATADANGFLPPKSTWIEPKLRSGLFIHEIQ